MKQQQKKRASLARTKGNVAMAMALCFTYKERRTYSNWPLPKTNSSMGGFQKKKKGRPLILLQLVPLEIHHPTDPAIITSASGHLARNIPIWTIGTPRKTVRFRFTLNILLSPQEHPKIRIWGLSSVPKNAQHKTASGNCKNLFSVRQLLTYT